MVSERYRNTGVLIGIDAVHVVGFGAVERKSSGNSCGGGTHEFLNLFIYNVNLYGFGIALDPIQRIRYRMGREGMIVSSDLSRSRENDDGKFGTIGEKGGSFARFFNALEHVFDGC